MRIEVIVRGLPGQLIRERVAQIVEDRMDKCADIIREIQVWAMDDNGAKPGGKRCRIRVVTSHKKSFLISRSGERLRVVLIEALDMARKAVWTSRQKSRRRNSQKSEALLTMS